MDIISIISLIVLVILLIGFIVFSIVRRRHFDKKNKRQKLEIDLTKDEED